MSLREEVELLRNIPLFSNIEPSKLKLIAFTSERLVFQPGAVLCRQGDPGDAAYIIMRGEADVTLETSSGPLHIATMGRNDIVGEIAILCDVPRTATVTATTETETLKITKELFFRLLQEFPVIAVQLLRELARRLDVTTAKLRDSSKPMSG